VQSSLAGDEGEIVAEFQEEALKMGNQSLFQFGFRAAPPAKINPVTRMPTIF
jgi:hypothetical protein